MEKNYRSEVLHFSETKKKQKPKRIFFEHQTITTINCKIAERKAKTDADIIPQSSHFDAACVR